MPTTYADTYADNLWRRPMPTTYADTLCRQPMPTTYADKPAYRKGCQANINRHAAIHIMKNEQERRRNGREMLKIYVKVILVLEAT